ncbi:hypothetical protein YC2023_065313 [Brassica napus]
MNHETSQAHQITLSPRDPCYHILNFTQAHHMSAPAMNHETSQGLHLTGSGYVTEISCFNATS